MRNVLGQWVEFGGNAVRQRIRRNVLVDNRTSPDHGIPSNRNFWANSHTAASDRDPVALVVGVSVGCVVSMLTGGLKNES